MPASNPAAAGLIFPEDRYAFRRGHRFPVLLPKGPVEPAVYTQAHYFVTLELGPRDESVVAEYPRAKVEAWVEVGEGTSPLLERLDADARMVLFGGEPPSPMRPRFQMAGDVEESASTARLWPAAQPDGEAAGNEANPAQKMNRWRIRPKARPIQRASTRSLEGHKGTRCRIEALVVLKEQFSEFRQRY